MSSPKTTNENKSNAAAEAATITVQPPAGVTADAIRAAATVLRLGADATPFLLVPDGPQKLRVESLKIMEGPKCRARIKCADVASFVDYCNAFKGEGSRIFCCFDKLQFEAVIDYHLKRGDGDICPLPCEHRATLKLLRSYEANNWIAATSNPMSQAAFADFLESNFGNVVEPSGAELLEIAKTLELKSDVNFKSAQRNHDAGYNLLYEEHVTSTAGTNRTLEVPAMLRLRLPLFEGSKPVEIAARLLYKLLNGQLTFTVRLMQIEQLTRAAVREAKAEIEQQTGLPVYYATVEGY